jgi:hypothetical protein
MQPMPAPAGRRMMRFSVTALLGLAISIAAVVCGSVEAADQDQPAAFAPAKTSKERLSDKASDEQIAIVLAIAAVSPALAQSRAI